MDSEAVQPTDLQDILAELKVHLEPKGVYAIRTHYRVTSDGASRRHLVLDFPAQAERHLIMSPRTSQRELAMGRMEKYTGITGDQAHRVLDLAHALSEINDLGGWAFTPPDEASERTTMDAHQIAGLEYTRYPDLADLYDLIDRRVGGTVSRIEMVNQKMGRGAKPGVRWAAWQYFYDADGRQIAAHQQHVMNILAANFVSSEEAARDQSDYHLRGLGKQLRLGPDAVVMLNMLLSNAQQKFGINRVELAR